MMMLKPKKMFKICVSVAKMNGLPSHPQSSDDDYDQMMTKDDFVSEDIWTIEIGFENVNTIYKVQQGHKN